MLHLVDKILNLAEKQADYAEVRYEKLDKNKIILKNSNLEVVEFGVTEGICIRVLLNGALATSYICEGKFEKAKAAVENAVKSAKASARILKKKIGFSKETPYKDNYEVKEKIKLKNVSIEEKIKEVVNIDKEIMSTKLKIPARFFDLSDAVREKLYMNSEGARIHSIIPRINFEYLLTFVGKNSEQRMYQFSASGGWEIFKNWDLKKKLLEEAKLLAKISKAPKAPAGKMDLLVSPDIAGIVAHESTGHPYEADRILGREAAQAGESFVTANMGGTRIGSDVVNLIDDPTIPHSFGFYLYDDEGVKAQKRLLIKNGIINSFLHNRETAFEFGIKSNAAARANHWNAEPIVRMANTFFMPGDHSFEELVEEIKKGIYIKSYMEWNIDDKRYNQRYGGLECYKILNGRICGLVRRPILEITTPAFYNSVDACGKDLDFSAGTCGKGDPMQAIPVWFGGPHIRLRNVFIK
jgi:TldD protein